MMGWWERVEDGTCSQGASVEYREQDTNTQEEAGNNKHIATSLPEISLPSPDSELSFPLLENSLSTSLTPLPPHWAEYSSHPSDTSDHVQPDDGVCLSRISHQIRQHPDYPSISISSDSTPFQPYFTPPDSPVEAFGGQGRSWKGYWRRAKTPPVEEMEISGSAAMDRVEMISIMEESDMITSNTSVLEEASSPIIVNLCLTEQIPAGVGHLLLQEGLSHTLCQEDRAGGDVRD